MAAEANTTPAAVSLAWLLQQPQVTSTIFGARSIAQLEDNVKAAEIALTEAQMKTLTEASDFELGYPYAFMKGLQGAW